MRFGIRRKFFWDHFSQFYIIEIFLTIYSVSSLATCLFYFRKTKKERSRAPSVEAVTCKKEPESIALKKEGTGMPNRRATISYPPSFDDRSNVENTITELIDKPQKEVFKKPESEIEDHLGPRVKVGPDGSLIIDEESLVC